MALSRGKRMIELCRGENVTDNVVHIETNDASNLVLSQELLDNCQWIVSTEETPTLMLPVENLLVDVLANSQFTSFENTETELCVDEIVATENQNEKLETPHNKKDDRNEEKDNSGNEQDENNTENENNKGEVINYTDSDEPYNPSSSLESEDEEDSASEYKENKSSGKNGETDEPYNNSSSSSRNKEITEHPLENKSRKRISEPAGWHDCKNKRLREQGNSYIGWSRRKGDKAKRGTRREARNMGPPCTSKMCEKSKVRHCNTLTEHNRKILFRTFWSDISWDQRKVYVSSLVKRVTAQRTTKSSGEYSRRKDTLTYTLKDLDGNILTVCKKMFLSTFGLKEWTVLHWVQGSHGMHTSTERHNSLKRESRIDLFSEAKRILCAFLDAIPKLPSHYCRQSTSKLYVEPVFGGNMTGVYNEYVKQCKEGDANIKPLSRFSFDNFIKQKNISFQTPKKDQCDTCCSYSTNNLDKETYDKHIEKKIAARNEKNEDKANGERGECVVLTQDVQAVKVCPNLNASALYFKTKLCCHNFTIFNVNSHHTKCYWFDETDADLSANTFTTCIIDYLLENIDGTKPIIIWSDGCGYQNRNFVFSNALLHFSVQKQVTIFQKYLERGHTQMEADSVHAHIETKLKNKPICLPSDYCRITSEARKNPPYEVKRISFDFVKDYSVKEMIKFESIRPGNKANDPTVNDIKVIKYTPDGNIQVKLSFSSSFEDLPRRGKKKTIWNLLDYPQLHKAPLKIKYQKWLHLQQLKTVIPKDCHLFYDNLPHKEQ